MASVTDEELLCGLCRMESVACQCRAELNGDQSEPLGEGWSYPDEDEPEDDLHDDDDGSWIEDPDMGAR